MRLQWLSSLDPATGKSAPRSSRVPWQSALHFFHPLKAPAPQAFFPLYSILVSAFLSPFFARGFLYYQRSNYIRGLAGFRIFGLPKLLTRAMFPSPPVPSHLHKSKIRSSKSSTI